VREVRDRDGSVRWRHDVRPVRRVVSADVASQLSAMLRNAVEEGTGRRAALGTYQISGKTGTVRRNINGRYVEGRYTASFVGMFPSSDPQLVLLVKIDDPEGDYFGGSRAAPVTRAIIEAALATPAVSIDRSRISQRRAPSAAVDDRRSTVASTRAVVAWPLKPDSAAPGEPRPVPDVGGQTLRAAARTLHRAGFRVRIEGWGTVVGTSPSAGTDAPPGSAVVVRGESSRAI
jgi:stage V sporulation protein D (sporulation-specific penicillin-binding protein)